MNTDAELLRIFAPVMAGVMIKRPNILWARPFQTVNPKVRVSYIYVGFSGQKG